MTLPPTSEAKTLQYERKDRGMSQLAAVSAKNKRKTLPDLYKLMRPDRQKRYDELKRRDPALMEQVDRSLGRQLRAVEEHNNRLRKSTGNVATDNSQAAVFGLKKIIGEANYLEFVRRIVPLLDLNSREYRELETGGHYVDLRTFSFFMEEAWVETTACIYRLTEAVAQAPVGLMDAITLLAFCMKHIGWGPISDYMNEATQSQDIDKTYASAKVAVGVFNYTKKFTNDEIMANRAIISSTILESIALMMDYVSRRFVTDIMADVPYAKYEVFLKATVGIGYSDILAEFAAEQEKDPGLTASTGLIPGIMTEGMWQWWWNRHPNEVARYQLPKQIRADLKETALQFPLVDAINYHVTMARRLNQPVPITVAYERAGRVYVLIDGVEREIAHRVKFVKYDKRKRRLIWRELETNESYTDAVLLVTQDISWCMSAAYAAEQFICEAGQLWNMSFSQWDIRWTNPPLTAEIKKAMAEILQKKVSLWEKLKAIARVGSGIAKLKLSAAPEAVRREEAKMAERGAQLIQQVVTGGEQLIDILHQSHGDLAAAQQRLRELNHAMVEQYTSGHTDRLCDLCPLYLAFLEGYHEDPEKLAAVLARDPKQVPEKYLLDQRFWDLRMVIDKIRFIMEIHDIGKWFSTEKALTGEFDPDEQDVLFAHPRLTYEVGILIFPEAEAEVQIAAFHHENWKVDEKTGRGTGYPWKLTPNELPWLALAPKLTDNFDGCAGPRPYRLQKSKQMTMELKVILDIFRGGVATDEIPGWEAYKFVEFLLWIRDHLTKESRLALRTLGLSKPTIDMILGLEPGDPGFSPNPIDHQSIFTRSPQNRRAEEQIFFDLRDRFGHERHIIDWKAVSTFKPLNLRRIDAELEAAEMAAA